MHKLIVSFILICCVSFSGGVIAQSVIVIPFYKQGEDRRAIIEGDPCYRVIETKIKEAFLKKASISLIDYLAIIRRLGITDKLNGAQDIVTLLVQNADPDIYIIADIIELSKVNNGKQEHKLTLNLTAYRSFSGEILAAEIINSGWRYYSECSDLAIKTFLNKDISGQFKIDVFIDTFTRIEKIPDGLPMSFEFMLTEEATFDFYEPITNGKVLAQSIDEWMKGNSVEERASSSISAKYIKFPSVLMQLAGNPEATTEDICFAFLSYLNQLSAKVQPDSNLDFRFSKAGNGIVFYLH